MHFVQAYLYTESAAAGAVCSFEDVCFHRLCDQPLYQVCTGYDLPFRYHFSWLSELKVPINTCLDTPARNTSLYVILAKVVLFGG